VALDPISAGIDLVSNIISKIWPDANEKEKTKLAELQAAIGVAMGQMEINKEEAKHPSIFVAGWRPFIGWVCGIALTWHYLAGPAISYFTSKPLPNFDMGALMTLLFGMLGLITARTVEKVKNAEGNR